MFGFTQDLDTIKLDIENMDEEEYSLVIAADGFHSQMRGQTQISMIGEKIFRVF